MLVVGLNRAVTLIEEKKTSPRRGRFGGDPGRTLGDHPQEGGPIVVRNGRYGPYVSHDGVNATLPGDVTPEAITLDQAIGLLEARAARGPAKRTAARRGSSGRKAAVKSKVAAGPEAATSGKKSVRKRAG